LFAENNQTLPISTRQGRILVIIYTHGKRVRAETKQGKLKMATFSQAIESANALICSGQGIISVEIEFVTKAGISFRGIWNGLTFERLERIAAA
jgi:hypothetical protein